MRKEVQKSRRGGVRERWFTARIDIIARGNPRGRELILQRRNCGNISICVYMYVCVCVCVCVWCQSPRLWEWKWREDSFFFSFSSFYTLWMFLYLYCVNICQQGLSEQELIANFLFLSLYDLPYLCTLISHIWMWILFERDVNIEYNLK